MGWLKKRIRRRLQAARAHLDPAVKARAEQQIYDRLFALAQFQQVRHIALYFAVGNEVATRAIITQIHQHNKLAYLPVLSEGKSLSFVKMEADTPLNKNRLGILEPQGAPVLLQSLDLVLTPLVAFDSRCNRLGMGGGFYDTTFAFKRQQTVLPYLIGLAFEFQKVLYVPHTNLDIKLDAVITEKKIYGSLKDGMYHP